MATQNEAPHFFRFVDACYTSIFTKPGSKHHDDLQSYFSRVMQNWRARFTGQRILVSAGATHQKASLVADSSAPLCSKWTAFTSILLMIILWLFYQKLHQRLTKSYSTRQAPSPVGVPATRFSILPPNDTYPPVISPLYEERLAEESFNNLFGSFVEEVKQGNIDE